MNEKTNDTRLHVLDVGYQLIVNNGFNGVGLSQLLKEADVPKGSFYHYFKSKEQFGEALIQHYFENYTTKIEAILVHGEGNHYQRILSYFSLWAKTENGTCNAHKCLVVKLSAEVSDLSDPMRQALLKGAEKVTNTIEQCIVGGIADGSIKVEDSQEAAQNLYSMWLGASLLSKLSQSSHSLRSALSLTERILKGESH
ncbi:TetR/AcrR family transcriptional regulator [Vibrio sp. Sgm 22]|uniref:TetR/AcrR family transcriptional regulator n=1 Tax=Vibrio TaxID=662 RepID=UPI002050EF70|nr:MULTISPECIES: TetR/AcrR family transcriptional regulator [Vibrio]MCX2760617.1 TetR/AcrR family transcriptional regulator [Vibrio sp. 14G-20]MCX2777637.1 TetR/AcrR family transcriptional regulator [Vibrio sp. Sgm 22]UPR37306.1 TetR/AcrR family transcriptional regulator [Vibrio cyclitrophicus]UXA00346.1 TetR/AcrR family transcriptional regulator [Vibrio splendidus]